MSSPKTRSALARLGEDLRQARLGRGMAVADLAIRSGVSTRTISRLENGHTGVALGALSDVLLVLGLIGRLADLVDIRHDDLGLALASERTPKRARSHPRQRARKRSAAQLAGDLASEGEAL